MNSFLFQMHGKYLILKKIINNDKTIKGLAWCQKYNCWIETGITNRYQLRWCSALTPWKALMEPYKPEEFSWCSFLKISFWNIPLGMFLPVKCLPSHHIPGHSPMTKNWTPILGTFLHQQRAPSPLGICENSERVSLILNRITKFYPTFCGIKGSGKIRKKQGMSSWKGAKARGKPGYTKPGNPESNFAFSSSHQQFLKPI